MSVLRVPGDPHGAPRYLEPCIAVKFEGVIVGYADHFKGKYEIKGAAWITPALESGTVTAEFRFDEGDQVVYVELIKRE